MGGAEQEPDGRRGGFGALPTTTVGRVTGVLLALAVVLIAVNVIWILPYTESFGGSQALQHTFSAIVAAGVALAGLTAVAALLVKRDRSWVVWLAIAVFVAALALMAADVFAQE